MDVSIVYLLLVLTGVVSVATVSSDCVYKECLCTGTKINCQNSGLTTFPTPQPDVPFGKVDDLDISKNQIRKIPAGHLPPGLENLDARENPIFEIESKAFDDCETTLEEVYFEKARFSKLPDALGKLKALTTFHLGETKIDDWNNILSAIGPTLHILYMTNVGLTTWPDSLKQMSNLTTLNLGGDAVSTVPDDAFDLIQDKLQSLTINYPKLGRVPKCVSNLTSLVHLSLNNCSIARVSNIPPVSELNLADNAISNATALADALQLSTDSLLTLDLSGNQLTEVPELSNFTFLSYLFLSHNEISNLNKGSLPPSLLTLWVDSNKFDSVPDEVASLSSLLKLALGFNRIKNIDASSIPVHLTDLFLSSNKIKKLTPSSFGNSSSLNRVDLGLNPIDTIEPGTFPNLENLKNLWLNDTNITSIPLDFPSSLHNLNMFGVKNLHCPCPTPPQLLAWYDQQKAVFGTCDNKVPISDYLSGSACITTATPKTPTTVSTPSTTGGVAGHLDFYSIWSVLLSVCMSVAWQALGPAL